MRAHVLVPIAIAALTAVGCGNRNLVLSVDVLSYLGPAQRQVSVPFVPAGTLSAPVAVVPDTTIDLIDGLGDVAEARTVTLSFDALATAARGSGSGLLRLYFCGEGVDPATTRPVVEQRLRFEAGISHGVSAEVTCDPSVAELFTKPRLRMAVTLDSASVAAPGATGVSVTLQRLEVVMVAGRKPL